MGRPRRLGGHVSWAVVSVQPAVHGVALPWALPGLLLPKQSFLVLWCHSCRPLQAVPPHPCREASLRARRGTPCNHLVQDCDRLSPWDGPGPGWLCAQVAAWERPWGGWAGVPGKQSKGNLSSGGGAGARGHSRSPRALCSSTHSGLWLGQPRLYASWCSQQPWWEPQPILAGNIYGVGIVFGSLLLPNPSRSPQLDPANRAALLKSQGPRGETGRSGGCVGVLSWFGVPTLVGLLGGEQGLWMGQGSPVPSVTQRPCRTTSTQTTTT